MSEPAREISGEVLSDERSNPETGFTVDSLLGGRLLLRQPAEGYRAAIDPVLLAAAVPAESGDTVLDAGAGTAAALLCLAARVPGCRILGLERDEPTARLGHENVASNGFSDRAEISVGDIAKPPMHLLRGSFDHVMMNPPHLDPGRARSSADPGRAAAMVEGASTLSDWVGFAHEMLRERGTLTVIHRADRLDQLMAALTPRFGGIIVFALWPGGNRAAKRVIVRAAKNSHEPAIVLPGLTLHGEDGRFTVPAERVLREGQALKF